MAPKTILLPCLVLAALLGAASGAATCSHLADLGEQINKLL
jgi:hypothetical protein